MIQCFVKHAFDPAFRDDHRPRLLYVSRVDPDGTPFPRVMHSHQDFAEIVLVRSGVCQFFIGGRRQFVAPGDLIIYNSGVLHDEGPCAEHQLGSYCLAVGDLALPGLRKNALLPDAALPVLHCQDALPALERLCEMMFDALCQNTCQSEKFAQCLLEAFLIRVMPALTGAEPEPRLEERALGERIRQYLDRRYMLPLELSDIAAALHISAPYLSHVFKKTFGYSPINYLQRRRIGEALLIETSLSITEIGERVGFDTASHFSSCFAKQIGMSPKKYRDTYVVREPPQNNRCNQQIGIDELCAFDV